MTAILAEEPSLYLLMIWTDENPALLPSAMHLRKRIWYAVALSVLAALFRYPVVCYLLACLIFIYVKVLPLYIHPHLAALVLICTERKSVGVTVIAYDIGLADGIFPHAHLRHSRNAMICCQMPSLFLEDRVR